MNGSVQSRFGLTVVKNDWPRKEKINGRTSCDLAATLNVPETCQAVNQLTQLKVPMLYYA